jgi:hypothetical protein
MDSLINPIFLLSFRGASYALASRSRTHLSDSSIKECSKSKAVKQKGLFLQLDKELLPRPTLAPLAQEPSFELSLRAAIGFKTFMNNLAQASPPLDDR